MSSKSGTIFLEYSKSSKAACKVCKCAIQKGDIRIGIKDDETYT